MSSRHSLTQNTYESLVDDNHSSTGAATSCQQDPFIQAEFEEDVLVRSVTVSGANKMNGTWSSKDINGAALQYRKGETTWKTVLTFKEVKNGEPTKFTLETPRSSRNWRIWKNGFCFLATGTLIFE